MKTAVLCAVVMALAKPDASAAIEKFDTLGFESGAGYTLGDLHGQQGWIVEIYGSGSAVVVDGTISPVVGGQALRLTAPGSVDDPEHQGLLINDGVLATHLTTAQPIKWARVSFDVWREPGAMTIPEGDYQKRAFNRLFWWTRDSSSNFGVQWDTDNQTYPFGWSLNASSAATVAGSYVNVTLMYDFTGNVRSSWYNGAQVDDNIALDETGQMKGLTDIEIYYEQSQPFKAGTYGFPTYIDNLYVEYELDSVPEPAPLIALSVGIVGLIGLRGRRKFD